jgi:SagB-type dehydrogenase family enzyme
MTGQRMRRDVVGLAVLVALATGCSHAAPDPPGERLAAQVDPVMLPAPKTTGPLPLETVISRRRSQRDYAPGALTAEEIAQLTWAAQGITDKDRGLRASPSAGALYPLELYVVDAQGVWHYEPAHNALRRITTGDHRADLQQVALGQQPVGAAAANLVFTGVMARSRPRYKDRTERYVNIEVGHAGENVLLQATALGLGAVPIAAFDDDKLRGVLGVGADETPLYIICVGRLAP